MTNQRRCSGFFFSSSVIFCHVLSILFVTLCDVMTVPSNSLGRAAVGGGLPDDGTASPAARRACQPAGGIEVNKLKCMYMLRDRLLSEQRGICGAGLLGSPSQP